MNTIKDRIITYIKSKNISVRSFEINSGLSNGYINRLRKEPSPTYIDKILNSNPELNRAWLLTGEGEMLKTESQKVNAKLVINKLKEIYNYKTNAEIARKLGITPARLSMWIQRGTIDNNIVLSSFPELSADWLITGEGEMIKKESKTETSDIQSNKVPLLSLSAQGGRLDDFVLSIKNYECEKIISPVKADFAVTISGDSMAPEYTAGYIVLVKKLTKTHL